MQKKQYCFILNNHFCSIATLTGDECTYLSGFYFDNKNQVLQKEQLIHHINELNLPVFQADEVSIAWVSEHSCLLPYAVYEPGMMKDFYLTCFPEIQPQCELESNRIPNLSIVNIFEIPLWIKSYFVLRFPKVVVKNHQTIALTGLLEEKSYFLNIQVSIFPDLMSIIMMEKNEILFSNSFEVKHENDIIYYLGFTLQQLGLEQKKGKISLSLHPLVDFAGEETLKKSLKTISTFDQFDLRFDALQPFKFHRFCV